MKRLRNWLPPTMAAVGMSALGLLIGAHTLPEQPWLAAVPLAMYWAAAMLCNAVPGKLRLPVALLSAVVPFWFCAEALPWRENPVCWLLPVVCAGLLLTGLPRSVGRAWSIYTGSLCVVVHIAGQLMLMGARRNGIEARYLLIEDGLAAGFAVFLVLAMLNVNRSSLEDAAASGVRPPASMRRKNAALTLGVTALTLLIAALPAVVEAFRRAWYALMTAIARFMEWIGSLSRPVQGGEPASGEREMLMLGEAETNALAEFLEKILIWIGVVLAAVVIVFLLVVLVKKLIVLARYLWARLREYAAAASGDYVDEVSETREWREIMESVRKKLRPRHNPLRGIDEGTLSPGERIRFRYLKLWLKHPEWKEGRTARENLSDDAAAALYERARYSRHEITPEEAERFAGESEKL